MQHASFIELNPKDMPIELSFNQGAGLTLEKAAYSKVLCVVRNDCTKRLRISHLKLSGMGIAHQALPDFETRVA